MGKISLDITLSRLLSGYIWVNTWYSLYKQGLQQAYLSSDASPIAPSTSSSTAINSSSKKVGTTLNNNTISPSLNNTANAASTNHQNSNTYDQHQYNIQIAIQQVDFKFSLAVILLLK